MEMPRMLSGVYQAMLPVQSTQKRECLRLHRHNHPEARAISMLLQHRTLIRQ